MNISIELIDEIRKRTNCSYQEAKELLEKHDGDIVGAIIEFEKKNGNKSKHHASDHKLRCGKKIKRLVEQGFATRFIIEKKENTFLNIPINILILAVLITMPVFWLYPIAFVILYLMGFKIRIRKEEGQEIDINEFVDGIGSKIRAAKDKKSEQAAEKDQNGMKSEEKKDDGYNKITIE